MRRDVTDRRRRCRDIRWRRIQMSINRHNHCFPKNKCLVRRFQRASISPTDIVSTTGTSNPIRPPASDYDPTSTDPASDNPSHVSYRYSFVVAGTAPDPSTGTRTGHGNAPPRLARFSHGPAAPDPGVPRRAPERVAAIGATPPEAGGADPVPRHGAAVATAPSEDWRAGRLRHRTPGRLRPRTCTSRHRRAANASEPEILHWSHHLAGEDVGGTPRSSNGTEHRRGCRRHEDRGGGGR